MEELLRRQEEELRTAFLSLEREANPSPSCTHALGGWLDDDTFDAIRDLDEDPEPTPTVSPDLIADALAVLDGKPPTGPGWNVAVCADRKALCLEFQNPALPELSEQMLNELYPPESLEGADEEDLYSILQGITPGLR